MKKYLKGIKILLNLRVLQRKRYRNDVCEVKKCDNLINFKEFAVFFYVSVVLFFTNFLINAR